jgi:transposase-like protein
MKCPTCGKENNNTPTKQWIFNVFEVSRYKCSGCGNYFNVYIGENKTYTIPKSR